MLEYLLAIASGLVSTVYGYGETMCGDVGRPRPCSHGAVTASGDIFDPSIPSIAIAAPAHFRLKPTKIFLRVGDGPCKPVLLLDKMNPRYMGIRGFDLTPAAVELLTGTPATAYWSDIVHVCAKKRWQDSFWGPNTVTKLNTSRYVITASN